jgi:hypothetical protein
MRRLSISIGFAFAVALAALALIVASPASATAFTVSPWAYACGETHFGNPASNVDTPGEANCPDTAANQPGGASTSSYVAGVLTMSKTGQTSNDMSAGATIGGLVTLTAASWDLAPGSYCGAGAPRLNVVTTDGQIHFFGCAANNKDGHVSVDLSAAGDGAGNGGVVGKDVKSIDFVQDESGTAILKNLAFTGNAAASPTPSTTPTPATTPTPSASATASATATPTATPAAATLATTGGGRGSMGLPIGLLLGALLALAGLSAFAIRRRTA